ncbi:MAG: CBS domain-containing protein [Hyphomicrobiaceae bacterium]
MRISHVVDRKGHRIFSVWPNRTLKDVIELLDANNVASLVVCEPDGRPVGIVTDRDVIRTLARRGTSALSEPVRLSMLSPPPVCSPQDTVSAVLRQMTEARVRHVVVTDRGLMVGLVSIGDLVKVRLDDAEIEGRVLRERALGQMAFEQ